MNTLTLRRDDCMSPKSTTHPTESRAIAGSAASVMGLDTSTVPHTRETAGKGIKGDISTQAGGREHIEISASTFLLKYPNSSHRLESKHSCGFRWDGLVQVSVTSHPKGVADGFAA